MASCVHPYDATKNKPTPSGFVHWFADESLANGKTVKLSVVGPHLASHLPHRHAEDEFFFILEGQAEFYLDGATQVVGPQTLLYCPSWHEHGIRNVGDKDLRYLVIKQYGRPVAESATKTPAK
ncbi:MAG: cupin domain-containing protein [Verrucomicrobia bacterium]|nr:cupin domain-containing protein [Verrucomicrobiota bacterium]